MNGLIHSRKFVWKLILLFAYFLLGKQQTNNVIIFLKRNLLYCRFPFPFSTHPLINQVPKEITWTFHTFSSYNHFESPFTGAVHQKERKAKNKYVLALFYNIFFLSFHQSFLQRWSQKRFLGLSKPACLLFVKRRGPSVSTICGLAAKTTSAAVYSHFKIICFHRKFWN